MDEGKKHRPPYGGGQGGEKLKLVLNVIALSWRGSERKVPFVEWQHTRNPPGQGCRCASISRKSQIKRCITLEVLQGNIVLKDLSLSPDCRINVAVSPVRRCAPSRHFAFLYTIIRTVSDIKGIDHSVEVLFVLLASHDHLSKHVYSK